MPGPVAPRPRRLETLTRSAIGKPRIAQHKATVKDQCCDDPKIEDDGEMKVCVNCGNLFEESNIVADVTFSEDARGAATVQGGFVGENARHARTLNTTALRRLGGSERNTFAEIESNGRRVLNSLCPSLNISELVQNQAANIWGLAAKNNFNAGRRTDEVVAACLYAACRRQPNNDKLMIDISEKINTGPFRLGGVYKDLCQALYLGGDDVSGQYQVEIEPLIMKYCRQLEFGDKTRQVAEDAIKIVRRMDRDWMTSGRHPAGLCGACIILAARMNNFRRSVREVVWVAKVADVTIMKRIEEFRRTKAAAMTVEEFRQYGPLLKYQHDPPSLNAKADRDQKLEERRKRRQQRIDAGLSMSREGSVASSLDDHIDPSLDSRIAGGHGTSEQDTIEIQDDGRNSGEDVESDDDAGIMDASEKAAIDDPRPNKRARLDAPIDATSRAEPRLDADGFVIPALPLPNKPNSKPDKKALGRPRKDEPPEPLRFTLEELITEEQLLREIERNLSDEPVMQIVESEIERAERAAQATSEREKRVHAERTFARRAAEGFVHVDPHNNSSREIITAEELEAEFADDPEVNNCILNDAEARVKEQIWVSHNEAWLRQQYEKELIKRIEEARGGKQKAKRGGAGKKKRHKMGDGSLLNEATTPIDSPADATRVMLDKHADRNFSKFVDYDVIERIFGDNRSTASMSRSNSVSRAGTPASVDRVAHVVPMNEASGSADDPDEAVRGAMRRSAKDAGAEGADGEQDGRRNEADSPVGSQWNDDGSEAQHDNDHDDDLLVGEDGDYDAALDSMGGAAFSTYDDDGDDDGYGDY